MTTNPFDPRRPPPGAVDQSVMTWMTETCRHAPITWGKLLAFPAEIRPGIIEQYTSSVAIARVSPEAVCFLVQFKPNEPTDRGFLMVFPRPVLLALHSGIMGETLQTLPQDRELSIIENSTSGYLLAELFLKLLARGWPKPDGPKFDSGPPATATALWRVPPLDPVLLVTLNMVTPFGEFPISFLMPRTPRIDSLAEPPVKEEKVQAPEVRSLIESLVREMSVELSVVLGTADMSLLDLALLNAGDVVLLKQKVSEPLQAEVSGKKKFHVWPGALGARHAIQVHEAV